MSTVSSMSGLLLWPPAARARAISGSILRSEKSDVGEAGFDDLLASDDELDLSSAYQLEEFDRIFVTSTDFF